MLFPLPFYEWIGISLYFVCVCGGGGGEGGEGGGGFRFCQYNTDFLILLITAFGNIEVWRQLKILNALHIQYTKILFDFSEAYLLPCNDSRNAWTGRENVFLKLSSSGGYLWCCQIMTGVGGILETKIWYSQLFSWLLSHHDVY